MCLILGLLETLLQIFERVNLRDVEVLWVCVLLGGLYPVHQVRLAGDLLVILVERDDLLRDAIHDLLFEVCVYVLWEAIEKVSDEFVIS